MGFVGWARSVRRAVWRRRRIDAVENLNLARNKFATLVLPAETFGNLKSLDISENFIENPNPVEHPLNMLRHLPKLRTLDVKGNPFTQPEEPPEGFNSRAEILVSHWRLETVDGEAVTDEDREAAKQLNLRLLEEERARKQAAEEDAG